MYNTICIDVIDNILVPCSCGDGCQFPVQGVTELLGICVVPLDEGGEEEALVSYR